MSGGNKYTEEKEGRVGDGGGAKEGLGFYADVVQWSWRAP